MHVAKLVLGLLLASPALAAETTSADAALQKARRDLAAKLEHQVKSLSTRATRSARATAADAPALFAADRRSLAEEDGYLMCEMMNYAVQCGTKLTQATCAVETDCSWVAGEGCGPSEQVTNEIGEELIIGTFSLIGPIFACGFSDATNCPADMCVVYGDSCSVSDASVDDAFEDESIAELMKMSFKCSAHAYETSCAANRECKWALPEDSFADDDTSDPFGYDDASDPDSPDVDWYADATPTEECGVADDAYDRVAAKYCAVDPATGGYSPDASAAAGVTDVGEAALLGAALAASLAALA